MIRLVMVVKDEAAVIARALQSVRPYVSSWLIVDTGSTDGTQAVIRDQLKGLPGRLVERPWVSFGANMTEALALAAKGRKHRKHGWTLRLDADMTVAAHEGFVDWLKGNPDPSVDAWNVQVHDHGVDYRLPLLVRGGQTWEYVGQTHEYLDTGDRVVRSVLGFDVHHWADGSNRDGKLERDLELLAADAAAGEPRAVFYTAESLRYLGRDLEAIEWYDRRATIDGGFVEEQWFASFQSARLRRDVDGLIEVWRARPWRTEPLRAAADIVAATEHDDVLFVTR